MLSHDDYNADEDVIKPDNPALMPWFVWLMENESDAFFELQKGSLEGSEAMLGFMPENPKEFAEAMLLLDHAGATNSEPTGIARIGTMQTILSSPWRMAR